MAAKAIISKKRKFVADGVFYSELNEVSGVLVAERWLALEMATAAGCVGQRDIGSILVQ
jgi:hypothetical protein